jgi:hypothetical protein
VRTIIPIATLYEYDSSIFTDIYIKGVSKDQLIEHFLLSYGDLTPIYQDPSYLRRHVTSVARSLQWTIDHLWEVTQLEYNPIENYDRMESWEDKGGGTFQKGKVDTEETFNKGDITTTFGKVTDSTHKVAAFNSSDPEVANTNNTTDSGSDSQTFGADSSHGSVTNGLDESTTKGTHEGRIHGNIGVTTSQQMMQSEIDLTTTYNFLDKVCELYANRLLIGVW